MLCLSIKKPFMTNSVFNDTSQIMIYNYMKSYSLTLFKHANIFGLISRDL